MSVDGDGAAGDGQMSVSWTLYKVEEISDRKGKINRKVGTVCGLL